MSDPFRITEKTAISFSGGRTSAYMLWRVLQSNGGTLPDGVEVCFANTGKEDEATLRFVRDCGVNWNVPIRWVEYRADAPGYALVDFDTASRNGEPFAAIILKRNYIPNPIARFCTSELKVIPIGKYLIDIGMAETKSDAESMSMLGMRADEPRRVAKIKDKARIPLYTAGITKEDIGRFWASNSFDLDLPCVDGVTIGGNCDLCFLKGSNQVFTLIKEKPSRAIWWASMEALSLLSKPEGARFRSDRPSYQRMADYAKEQSDMFSDSDDESIACFCGD